MTASTWRNVMWVALLGVAAAGAQSGGGGRPETPVLSENEYPLQLEEVVVRGKAPRWRQREPVAPDWEKGKFRLPAEAKPPRIEVMPRYTRDERDDYDQVRDRMNATPRIKVFEMKF